MTDLDPTDRDDVGFDAGATARQIGLFETANGMSAGILAAIIAFVLAAITYPIYRLRRRR